MNTRQKIITVILIILALTGLILYLFLGSVNAKIEKDSLVISATLTGEEEILFTDVEEILLYDSIDKGLPGMYFKNVKITTGWFSSSKYGPYHLMAHNNVEKFIIIKANDEYVIFNLKSAEKTETLYKDLQNKLNNLPGNITPEEPVPEITPEPTPEITPGPTFNIGGESPN